MSTTVKIAIVAALAVAVCVVLVAKRTPPAGERRDVAAQPAPSATSRAAPTEPLPRLVEVGAGKYKMMKPIMEEIRRDVATQPAPSATPRIAPAEPLPRLVEVGAGKCKMCKMMKPIMEEIRRDFAGQLEVEIVDLNVDPGARDALRIRMIPTQIFMDGDGIERDRHEGFIARSDILARWRKLGVDLKKTPQPGEVK